MKHQLLKEEHSVEEVLDIVERNNINRKKNENDELLLSEKDILNDLKIARNVLHKLHTQSLENYISYLEAVLASKFYEKHLSFFQLPIDVDRVKVADFIEQRKDLHGMSMQFEAIFIEEADRLSEQNETIKEEYIKLLIMSKDDFDFQKLVDFFVKHSVIARFVVDHRVEFDKAISSHTKAISKLRALNIFVINTLRNLAGNANQNSDASSDSGNSSSSDEDLKTEYSPYSSDDEELVSFFADDLSSVQNGCLSADTSSDSEEENSHNSNQIVMPIPQYSSSVTSSYRIMVEEFISKLHFESEKDKQEFKFIIDHFYNTKLCQQTLPIDLFSNLLPKVILNIYEIFNTKYRLEEIIQQSLSHRPDRVEMTKLIYAKLSDPNNFGVLFMSQIPAPDTDEYKFNLNKRLQDVIRQLTFANTETLRHSRNHGLYLSRNSSSSNSNPPPRPAPF